MNAASSPASGIENPGILDALAFDARSNRAVLAMYEFRPWTGGDAQRLQLQEKLNAYVSFALDGEMVEAYPGLAEKPITIQLRTAQPPDPQTLEMLERAREQLAFQAIELETVLIAAGSDAACGDCKPD